MPIIVDMSQIVIAAISVATNEFEEIDESKIRHLTLNMMLSFKKKFPKYGDLIIASDGGTSWRKKVFPYYKAGRAKSKADSPLDWKVIYECLIKIQNEIDEYLPWKLVRVNSAEGDDVISTLCRYFKDNELEGDIFPEPQKCLIVSTDKDFLQLQTMRHVKHYNHITNLLLVEPNPEEQLFIKILKGDAGDGIPNVLSVEDSFVNKIRQKQMTEKRIAELREKIKDGTLEEEVQRRYDMNKKLIDLINEIPPELENEIIECYKCASNSREKLFGYLIKNKMKNLMDRLDHF